MNEANVRRELYRMLRYRYGLWAHHIPDVKGAKRPGIPDLIVMSPHGPGVYIEVKKADFRAETAFAFNVIEDSQRDFLSNWETARPGGSYLAIGEVNRRGRRTYVIPWLLWLDIESKLSVVQNSLPFIAGPGYSKELQAHKLDFRLLEPFACSGIGDKMKLHPDLEHLWRIGNVIE